jgi:hypothetical protein
MTLKHDFISIRNWLLEQISFKKKKEKKTNTVTKQQTNNAIGVAHRRYISEPYHLFNLFLVKTERRKIEYDSQICQIIFNHILSSTLLYLSAVQYTAAIRSSTTQLNSAQQPAQNNTVQLSS